MQPSFDLLYAFIPVHIPANTSTMVEIPIQLLCDQSEDHSDGSRPTELGRGTKSSNCVTETSPTPTACTIYLRTNTALD